MPNGLSINICSPADGYVASLFVKHGQTVAVGDKLLQMDTEQDDLVLQKLATTESVNDIAARKYSGEQLQMQLDAAQKAIDLAKQAFDDATKLATDWQTPRDLGIASDMDVLTPKVEADKANIQLQIAQTNLTKLQFSAKNYQDTSIFIKSHIEAEKAAINARETLHKFCDLGLTV
jgi:multidrug resistance efflux pump